MRSSISSSDQPLKPPAGSPNIPPGPWLRTWLVTLLLTAGLLTSLELFWRSQGHRPSVVDSADLWAYYRSDASDRDGQAVVLLGDSRMQIDFSTDEFRRHWPDRPLLQLAVNGRQPLAALKDLAQDENFRGIVVCGVSPLSFVEDYQTHQQGFVDHYHHKATLNSMLNSRIASLIQQRLVVVNPQVHLLKAAARFFKLRVGPPPLYVTTNSDRSRTADYTLTDIHALKQRRLERDSKLYRDVATPSPQCWLAQAWNAEAWVRAIQRRGGRVVFVVFPTTGPYNDMLDQTFPRSFYWDRFAAITQARTLHFQDLPQLACFDCPDGSHLDHRDVPAFTAALMDELAARGVLAYPLAHFRKNSPANLRENFRGNFRGQWANHVLK